MLNGPEQPNVGQTFLSAPSAGARDIPVPPTTPGSTSAPFRGWLLYDGACGFCSAAVKRVTNIITRRGFHPLPLQTPWIAQRTGLSDEELLKDMRLLLNDGRLYSGADAYLYVMRRIWWTLPFALLFTLPGLHWLFARTYRYVADNRSRISTACALPPPVDFAHFSEQVPPPPTPPPPPAAAPQPSRSS